MQQVTDIMNGRQRRDNVARHGAQDMSQNMALLQDALNLLQQQVAKVQIQERLLSYVVAEKQFLQDAAAQLHIATPKFQPTSWEMNRPPRPTKPAPFFPKDLGSIDPNMISSSLQQIQAILGSVHSVYCSTATTSNPNLFQNSPV